jgi:hypothetical protein
VIKKLRERGGYSLRWDAEPEKKIKQQLKVKNEIFTSKWNQLPLLAEP